MTHPWRITAALLAGTLALGTGACGGGSDKHASKTPATTSTASTSTDATSGTTSTSKRPSLASIPAKTLTFSGSGIKDIGKPSPLKIPTASTIKWTNDGALFQIIPASVNVPSPVNSRDHSGQAKLRKGSYHGFLVNAIGHWTITIVPGG